MTTSLTARATGLAAALTLAGLGLAAPAAAADTSDVSILHGVPGLTVDVYANGNKLLTDFAPGTLTKPVKLPAGTYDLAVFPAGKGPTGDPAIKADDVKVPGGANITVVAHLGADGTPQLTPFVNDTSKVAAGKARITVRHTAAAPEVDVRAGGTVAFPGLANPKEATAELPAGTVKADVVLAGTDTVAIGPAELNLAEGTSTIVYAWGSAKDSNLALAVQTISGMHSAPHGVPSGDGGLVDDSMPATVWGSSLAALAGAGALMLIAARRRTATAAHRG